MNVAAGRSCAKYQLLRSKSHGLIILQAERTGGAERTGAAERTVGEKRTGAA